MTLLSELNELLAPAVGDEMLIRDVSEALVVNQSKRMQLDTLATWLTDVIGAVLLPAWQAWTPTWTAATTNPNIGNGTLSGRYCQVGKLVHCQLYMLAGSTTTFGTGVWRFSYPVAPNTTNANLYQLGTCWIVDTGTTSFIGITRYGGATYWTLYANVNFASSSHPMTWANTDVLRASFFFEAA